MHSPAKLSASLPNKSHVLATPPAGAPNVLHAVLLGTFDSNAHNFGVSFLSCTLSSSFLNRGSHTAWLQTDKPPSGIN
ncbi:hypothetical protein E2C01_054617 [Portunus trituberculatus]|uniref:Uncharacterized protein n=1 Tax=Portunus trituberculatus TaxID=210409 RepID=A0A5B7GTP6_PORTR|nr:hypothetical protein [Portunus trituberculatus]